MVLNPPKDDQLWATITELVLPPIGLEFNLLLAELKKESDLNAGCLVTAERTMDLKNSKLIELMTDEMDYFKKIDGDWGVELLYLTGK